MTAHHLQETLQFFIIFFPTGVGKVTSVAIAHEHTLKLCIP